MSMMLQFTKETSLLNVKEKWETRDKYIWLPLKTATILIVVNCPLLPLSFCSLLKAGARGKLLS